MLFRTGKFHQVDHAQAVRRTCEHCGNETDLRLNYVKAGPGLGVPVLMFFSDKFVLSTHKKYYLVCQTCGCAHQINKDLAKGLMQ
ncbi:MAG: hypothetical protein HQ567_19155 [Candidatus Nealsonbacteria bacterium]|nr:hypothetical protein [Candidatus Nealsonbacteria bacterium]